MKLFIHSQTSNGATATIEVWEWISNFIPYFIMDVITYLCWDLTMLVKRAPSSCGYRRPYTYLLRKRTHRPDPRLDLQIKVFYVNIMVADVLATQKFAEFILELAWTRLFWSRPASTLKHWGLAHILRDPLLAVFRTKLKNLPFLIRIQTLICKEMC